MLEVVPCPNFIIGWLPPSDDGVSLPSDGASHPMVKFAVLPLF